jgi:hypothetical protein
LVPARDTTILEIPLQFSWTSPDFPFNSCSATGRGGHPLGRHVRIRSVVGPISSIQYTDKKENKIILIYKEIQLGRVAKSYMRKCANIQPYMRRPLVVLDFVTDPSEFPYF